MELGQVHRFMRECKEIREAKHGGPLGSNRLDRHQMETHNRIISTPMLETIDAKVYVDYSHMDDPVWETHLLVYDYNFHDGALSIRTSGFDLDGDWMPIKTVTYPEGSWLKFEAGVAEAPVDNPYFIAPIDVSVGDETEEEGEGA